MAALIYAGRADDCPYEVALVTGDKSNAPGLALAEQLYQSVKAKGWSRNGTHALMLALSEMSGFDWRKR